MKDVLSERTIDALHRAPQNVRRIFYKQLRFLMENLQHPSLHAKKYDESRDLWQARVNRDWRFYFTIVYDAYRIEDLIPPSEISARLRPRRFTIVLTCVTAPAP
jgi:mRNA interferase RelE/StbE